MRVDKTSTNMNMHVSGGKNEKIGDLAALQMEKAALEELRKDKKRAVNKIIICSISGCFIIIPFFFIPRWVRKYKETNEYIKRAKAL